MNKLEEAKKEYKSILEYIKTIDFEDEQAYEKTLKNFINLNWIPVFTKKIPQLEETGKRTVVFRTRTHTDKDWFENISDITFPPNDIVKKFARVNRPFQSVFYGSENRPTSYMELVEYWASEKDFGEEVAVSIGMWEFQRNLNVLVIPRPYIDDRKTDAEKAYGEEYDAFIRDGKFNEYGIAISHLIFDYMSKEYMRPAKNDKKTYIITSAFSNLLLTRPEIDGLLYPSVPFGGEGYNLALKKSIVRNGNIKLVEVTKDTFIIKENERGKHHFLQTSSLSTKRINQKTGDIKW